MDKYAKKNLSTKQSPKSEKARIQIENENRRRAKRNQTQTCERSQEADTVSLQRLDFRLPKEERLRKRREIQEVYSKGRRIKGRFMTAFFMPSKTSFQRIGITASKKAIGNAVMRNRAKRLLREAFRLSKAELGALTNKYDWVLNARRSLLDVKLEGPLEEFAQIVEKVRQQELQINKGE